MSPQSHPLHDTASKAPALPSTTDIRTRSWLIGALLVSSIGVSASASAFKGSSLDLATLNEADGFTFASINADSFSGASARTAGDVNNDGYDDFIVGARGTVGYTGEIYVVFGSAARPSNLSAGELNGTNGFLIPGIAATDNAGFSVSGAGDVNNDGFDDIIIGAPGANANGLADSGQAYVIFGEDGFSATFDLTSLDGSNGFVVNGAAEDNQIGTSVSGAGDINDDGFDDVLIGAYNASPNGAASGETYVIYGGSSLAGSLDILSLNGTNGFALRGPAANDRSGHSVSGIGDINDDDVADFAIGAPRAAPGSRAEAGETYVVFGSTTAFPAAFELSSIDGINGFRVRGIAAGDRAGHAVSDAGDVNNDGIDDVLIGAYLADANGIDSGAAYVVYGAASFPAAVELSALDGTNGFTLAGAGNNDHAGISVASGGDVNGDNIADIVIGADSAAPSDRTAAGEAFVVYGDNTFPATLMLDGIDGVNGFYLKGGAARDGAGSAVSVVGDFDGDGYSDVLVGAPGVDQEIGADTGMSYLVYGFEPFRPEGDLDLMAWFDFDGDTTDNSRFRNNMGANQISYTPAAGGQAISLNPDLGALLWVPNNAAVSLRQSVSVVATVRLDSNLYSPVVAKYSNVYTDRKFQPTYALEILSRGRVKFSWLMSGQRTVSTCTTGYNVMNGRADNHIVASRNALNGVVRIWVNGAQKLVCRGARGSLQAGSRQLFVGSWAAGLNGGQTTMHVNDLKIYRRELTGANISELR